MQKDERQNPLDELFSAAKKYRRSADYMELMKFISEFHRYSAFNAMLVHIQMPGAKYVLTARRWNEEHGRFPVENAQALVMLQPMGPVMFGFDVSQTDGQPLPPRFHSPFQATGQIDSRCVERTIANARRDGVEVVKRPLGSTLGGYVRNAADPRHVIGVGVVSDRTQLIDYGGSRIPVFARITLSSNVDDATNYRILTHELGHLYCGHVGTPKPKWWPARIDLSRQAREFEAESVSYLACRRAGLETPAAEYLNGYLKDNEEVPHISLERVLRSAMLIEQMGQEKLKSRKGKLETSS